MIAMKEGQQKYFSKAEGMVLYPPVHSHTQHVHPVIPGDKVNRFRCKANLK